MSRYSAQYDLLAHINETVELGKALLSQARSYLENTTDPSDIKQANQIFASVSAQITALVKVHTQVLKADRERVREQVLIECLKEVDPDLANRFIDLFEQRLGANDLEQ